MIAFMIISLFFHEDKIRPKLNEGITLLQSLAIIYWVIDDNIFETKNIFIIILLVFGVLYSLYALVHAFSDISLNRGNRFKLSLWSSFVMLFLAVDNIIKVYNNGDIESYSDGMQAIYIGLQYFLLGVSGIYIVENILMLIRFLPDKHNFLNKVYFKDLRILQKEYVERFSEEQVLIKDSIYATLFTIFCFGLNFYFQWLPRNMMIWLVFVTIPYLFFWYPLLTQLALFVVFFSLFLWKERLHFCARKSAATFYLSLYYALGVFAVIFCMRESLYYQIVSISSLILASLVFLASILKSEDNG